MQEIIRNFSKAVPILELPSPIVSNCLHMSRGNFYCDLLEFLLKYQIEFGSHAPIKPP